MEDTLGDLLKEKERLSTCFHNGRIPLYVRLDGRSFSKITKNFAKPFSSLFIRMMQETTEALMREFSVDLGFCQSDEISLVILPRNTDGFTFPFGGKQAKIQSVFASFATWKFNQILARNLIVIDDPVCFDARSLSLSYEETALMFMWRHKDATRNAILQYAHNSGHLAKKSLHGQSTSKILERLSEQIDWESVPQDFRLGTFIFVERNGHLGEKNYSRKYLDKSYHIVYDFITNQYIGNMNAVRRKVSSSTVLI